MSTLFRSPFFLVVFTTLVLCGYGIGLVECGHTCQKAGASEVQGGEESKSAVPVADTGCPCVCHAGYVFELVVLPDSSEKLIQEIAYVVCKSEFPPDAVPLGIDYPPQLV